MLKGNVPCAIYRKLGYTISGEQTFQVAIKAMCSTVLLTSKVLHTTVRADSSATRGYADETTIEAKLLFPANVTLSVDDRIDIDGFKIRVVGIFPRRAVNGVLDHFEVIGEKWD